MQTAQGYLNQKTRSPTSLGVAFAINGAMVGALLFATPEVIDQARKNIPTIWVTLPPLTEELPKPATKVPPAVPHVTRAAPPVPLPTPMKFDTVRPVPDPPLGTPFTGGIGMGAGGGIVTPDPPRPNPVFIGPRPDPRYAGQMQPDYPAGLQRREIEGTVEVRVLIGPDGRVKRVEPISATDPGFFRATMDQAMKRWRFLPATRDGVAVESWRTMTVRFRLDS